MINTPGKWPGLMKVTLKVSEFCHMNIHILLAYLLRKHSLINVPNRCRNYITLNCIQKLSLKKKCVFIFCLPTQLVVNFLFLSEFSHTYSDRKCDNMKYTIPPLHNCAINVLFVIVGEEYCWLYRKYEISFAHLQDLNAWWNVYVTDACSISYHLPEERLQ